MINVVVLAQIAKTQDEPSPPKDSATAPTLHRVKSWIKIKKYFHPLIEANYDLYRRHGEATQNASFPLSLYFARR